MTLILLQPHPEVSAKGRTACLYQAMLPLDVDHGLDHLGLAREPPACEHSRWVHGCVRENLRGLVLGCIEAKVCK